MVKAIIFDCFGVVYDDSFDKVWASLGGDLERDQDFIKQTFYDSHIGKINSSALIFAKHLGVSEEAFRRANDEGRGISQEVLDFVQALRKKYTVGMLSNIGVAGLNKYIPQEVLEANFDAVVQSAQIGYVKPEPSAYQITADKLGVRNDECIFVDDRPEYVEGAVAVGMRGILFQNLDQLKNELVKYLAKDKNENTV